MSRLASASSISPYLKLKLAVPSRALRITPTIHKTAVAEPFVDGAAPDEVLNLGMVAKTREQSLDFSGKQSRGSRGQSAILFGHDDTAGNHECESISYQYFIYITYTDEYSLCNR